MNRSLSSRTALVSIGALVALTVTGATASAGTSGHLWTSQTQTGLGNDGYGTITG